MKRILLVLLSVLAVSACQDVTRPEIGPADQPRLDHYADPTLSIDGESYIYVQSDANWQYHTWTATASGGETPYTYDWEIAYDNLGGQYGGLKYTSGTTSTTDSVTFGVMSSDGSFTLRLTLTDKWGHTAVTTHRVIVSGYDSCGTKVIC